MAFRKFASWCVVAAALMLLGMGVAQARRTDNGAKAFLDSIYEAYVGSSAGPAKGVVLDSAKAVRRYFSPGLASLIIEDNPALSQPGEAFVTGSDPFVGRGSWEISNLAVDVKESGPVKAIGSVSFTNFGLPEKVEVELLKVGNDWRISEIKWGSLTLRSLYRKKWRAALQINSIVRQ
jgi:hypothetical protein